MHWPRGIRWGAWARSTMSSRVSCIWRTRLLSPARSCTWMEVKVPDTDALRDALERWKAGIDAHQPERVSEVFTEDAIFQGLRPYSVGRQGVADYYASQPLGLSAAYRILETRRPAEDLVLGYLSVAFSFADRPTVDVYLSVLLTHTQDGWQISHYQASRL